jgi:prepilin-type N-terminal cleavage/methylation domain-containing protein
MRHVRRLPSQRTITARKQGGFTIVELLVATLVFSVVLVLITIGVLQFNKQYYKGLTESTTQNTARSLMEDISQAIQFSGDQVTSPIGSTGAEKGLCIGNQRYSYLLGWQLEDGTPNTSKHQTNHAAVRDTPGNCGGLSAQDFSGSVSGTELLGPHMRISKLDVKRVAGSSNLYSIDVRVAYGDDDLLYSPSGDGTGPAAPDAACHYGWSGTQFCATSELSTTVEKRIN